LAAFIFLAAGLAPRRREDAAIAIEPVAIGAAAPATPMKTLEGRRKGAGRRHRACYLARLQREFPATAKRVEAGELSVHRACIKAGLRKEPAKPFKWTSIEAYAPATADASHAKTRPGNREAFFCVCRRSAPGQDADRRDNFLMPLIEESISADRFTTVAAVGIRGSESNMVPALVARAEGVMALEKLLKSMGEHGLRAAVRAASKRPSMNAPCARCFLRCTRRRPIRSDYDYCC
jgi:hypothetical protein